MSNEPKHQPSAPQTGCPPADVWRREIASGFGESEQILAAIEHASRCERCGPLLRAAVGELMEMNWEPTEEERREIAGLESSRAEWQLRLAERISGTVRGGGVSASWWKRWLTVPTLVAAGTAIVLLLGVIWWAYTGRNTADSANQLIARAYADRRTLEMRIPGAAYAPLRIKRGPAESFAARPAPLLKAEALIASQLTSHPEDPSWLQAAARADLLDNKYDAAVSYLERANELRPDSAEILIDLGTAHFQRAQSEGREEEYGAAFEDLSKALVQQPDNPTALFNRAVVAEHQFLYGQALEDWEHYLKIDSGSEWAEEARQHADAVRAKLKEHSGKARPLLTPAQIGPEVMDSEVDERVEEYLGEALRSWLPSAFPDSGIRADASAQRALFLLGDWTGQHHDDHWLADLLQGSSNPQFPRAVAALARAAGANDGGDYAMAAEEAARAEQLFQVSGNLAGRLRAQFEQVFAAQLSRRSRECRQKAALSAAESVRHAYPWLQIQFGLEAGVCGGLLGDLGGSRRNATEALEIAKKDDYGAVYLRAVGLIADNEFNAGNFSDAWKLISAGMEHFWSRQFIPLRGYSLYNIVGSYVDAAREPHLRVALWREAVRLIDADEDLAMRAGAHSALANAAASAQQLGLAEESYAEAARLFALAPRTGASLASALENEIRVAQLEARQGRLDAAVEQLTRNQTLIRQNPDAYLGQIFYSALGEVQLRTNQPADAELSLRLALQLAEKKLASLNSSGERILWSQDAAPLYLAMSEAKLVQGRAQDSLAVYEWYLSAAQRVSEGRRLVAIKAEPDETWLNARLAMLSDETVIAYGVLPDGVAIWTYDNRGVNVEWRQGAAGDLADVAERFYDSCSDPNSELSAVRRDGHDLYAALIAPVEERLEPGRTLVIEGNRWAARIPIEALIDGQGHALIERWPIVHSLGQYAEATMHPEEKISSGARALIVASTASSQEQDLIPLPDVVAEAEMVGAGFLFPEVLKAPDATLDAIRERLPAAGVFHFTGHALATPQQSGLLLANAGDGSGEPELLTADSLGRLDLRRLELAVLSTCGFERASDRSNGLSSITEAFERSGVPHVVASRWEVDSTETRRLMEAFYRALFSGQTVSNALRSSAQQMLSDPRTAHPYYWAAFAAYGRP